MSRRNKPEKPVINPDVRFNSVQVQSFINRVMKRGKKSVATTLVYDAIDLMEERSNRSGIEMFEQAIKNVSPVMAQPTRCRWKFLHIDVLLWQHAGSWQLRVHVRAKASLRSWLPNYRMLLTTPAPRSVSVTKRIRWLKLTVRFRIIDYRLAGTCEKDCFGDFVAKRFRFLDGSSVSVRAVS
jgi:hypothetical protein